MPEGPVYLKRHSLRHVIKYPIESAPLMRGLLATHARMDRFTNTSTSPTASSNFQIATQTGDCSGYVTPDLSSDQIKSQDLHIALTFHKIHMREQDTISRPWHLALRQNKKELHTCVHTNTKTRPERQQETLCTYKIRILRPRNFTRSTPVTFLNSEMTLL